MRAATALAAFSAAVAIIVTSCDSGSTPPSAPKEEGRYCAYNKNYYNDYDYYNYCPSVLCAYTGYNMTGYDYDSGRCVPPVASSSSTPRSSSSERTFCCPYDGKCYVGRTSYDQNCVQTTSSSSSVDVCPTNKCDCTPGFDKIYKEVMGEYTAIGMAHSSFAKEEAAKRAGCTL